MEGLEKESLTSKKGGDSFEKKQFMECHYFVLFPDFKCLRNDIK